MKKKENSTIQLLSNVTFVMRFLFDTNKKVFITRWLLVTVQVFSTFIPILFTRKIINSLTMADDIQRIIFTILSFSVLIFFSDTLTNIISYFDNKEITQTRYLANLKIGKAIMNFSFSEIEKPQIKNFVSLAQGDSLIYIFTLVMNMISSIVKVIGLTAIVLTIQPLILLLIFGVIIIKMIIDKKRREVSLKWRNIEAQYGREEDYLYEIMRDIPYAKEVRVNNISTWLYDKLMRHTNEKIIPIIKSNARDNGKLDVLLFLSKQIQDSIVYFFLAYKVIRHNMGIGDFSMYMTSINSFIDGINGVFGNFSNIIQQGLFAKEFRYCIEHSTQCSKTNYKENCSHYESVKIEFRNVSFKYPGTERMIINNISFVLDPEETLSIVGENGAGKTTLVKLICRFYNPTEGTILLNDIPIQHYSDKDYYDIIGAVFQDFKLFSFSVLENITFSQTYNKCRLLESINKSGLNDKIDKLSKGLQTYISKEFDESGIDFSGGEGQKIAIARALYKEPSLIILDEPTSALDPIAEYDLYRKFDDLAHGKTTIYISHRLSSTKFTDKILVLDNGYIAEYGNHNELMNIDDGIYKKMFDMQAQYYNL